LPVATSVWASHHGFKEADDGQLNQLHEDYPMGEQGNAAKTHLRVRRMDGCLAPTVGADTGRLTPEAQFAQELRREYLAVV
jgi:hypothetical protein